MATSVTRSGGSHDVPNGRPDARGGGSAEPPAGSRPAAPTVTLGRVAAGTGCAGARTTPRPAGRRLPRRDGRGEPATGFPDRRGGVLRESRVDRHRRGRRGPRACRRTWGRGDRHDRREGHGDRRRLHGRHGSLLRHGRRRLGLRRHKRLRCSRRGLRSRCGRWRRRRSGYRHRTWGHRDRRRSRRRSRRRDRAGRHRTGRQQAHRVDVAVLVVRVRGCRDAPREPRAPPRRSSRAWPRSPPGTRPRRGRRASVPRWSRVTDPAVVRTDRQRAAVMREGSGEAHAAAGRCLDGVARRAADVDAAMLAGGVGVGAEREPLHDGAVRRPRPGRRCGSGGERNDGRQPQERRNASSPPSVVRYANADHGSGAVGRCQNFLQRAP